MAVLEYKKEGRIAIFTINRPEAMNAMGAEVSQLLNEAMLDFRDDPELRAGIITGTGDRAFSAGADIKALLRPGGAAPTRPTEQVSPDTIWKPFIAAINGYCLGGGLELALRCDIRIAAEHATIGLTEPVIGRLPGGGGTQRLPRFVPRALAAEMLLTGQRITAAEAYRIGLVNRVVPLDQLMPTAMQLAETICRNGPLAVKAIKESMLRGINVPLEEGLRIERDLSLRLRTTEDYLEGSKAFAAKRPAVWQGK